MAKVFLAQPNLNWLHRETTRAIVQMCSDNQGHEVVISSRSHKPIDSNRNHLVVAFLESDADFMLFVDSDNPPRSNPLELVEKDLDIVVCPTPVYKRGDDERWDGKPILGWNVHSWDEDADIFRAIQQEAGGLHEIDAGGTGCMLIARRVLEHEAMRPAFFRRWNDDGTAAHGSDLWFCVRARRAGFKVWASWDHLCSHYKEVDLLKLWQSIDARDIRYARGENINTPEYWDEQWSKRGERILPQYERIAELVGPEARVLDYGCGRGDLLNTLGPNAVGYDISETALEVCRERGLTTTQLIGSLTSQWDVIVSTQVLEHVDNDRELIEQWFEMAPRVIFSVPWDCFPPGMEREHRRVYDSQYVSTLMPEGVTHTVEQHGPYMLVVAERAGARV